MTGLKPELEFCHLTQTVHRDGISESKIITLSVYILSHAYFVRISYEYAGTV